MRFTSLVFIFLVRRSFTAKAFHSQNFIGLATSDQLKLIASKQPVEKYSENHKLLKPFLVPRVSGSHQNKIIQTHLIKTLKELNYHIELDTFSAETPMGIKEFNNIIATKDPLAQKKLVLSAHFDSKYFKDFEFIGATDSSVPCAILLDVATSLNSLFDERLELKAKGKSSKGGLFLQDLPTLQLIFFDGEEAFESWTETDSLYGSRHLAKKWHSTYYTPEEDIIMGGGLNAAARSRTILSSINALILLDLLGTDDISPMFNTNENTQEIWDRISSIENRLWELGLLSQTHGTLMKRTSNKHGYFISGWTTRSAYSKVDDDHRPFRNLGVPCVHVIPQPFPRVWHTKNDDAAHLNMDTVGDYALIFRVLVTEYFGLLE